VDEDEGGAATVVGAGRLVQELVGRFRERRVQWLYEMRLNDVASVIISC
jgi:hypothetical protein